MPIGKTCGAVSYVDVVQQSESHQSGPGVPCALPPWSMRVQCTALHCCMPSRDNCVKELLKDRAYIIRSMLRYVLRYAKANDLLAYAPIVKCGCARCTGFLMLVNPLFFLQKMEPTVHFSFTIFIVYSYLHENSEFQIVIFFSMIRRILYLNKAQLLVSWYAIPVTALFNHSLYTA
jgi:hypothetical protein